MGRTKVEPMTSKELDNRKPPFSEAFKKFIVKGWGPDEDAAVEPDEEPLSVTPSAAAVSAPTRPSTVSPLRC